VVDVINMPCAIDFYDHRGSVSAWARIVSSRLDGRSVLDRVVEFRYTTEIETQYVNMC
jgi:hypothetical protein